MEAACPSRTTQYKEPNCGVHGWSPQCYVSNHFLLPARTLWIQVQRGRCGGAVFTKGLARGRPALLNTAGPSLYECIGWRFQEVLSAAHCVQCAHV